MADLELQHRVRLALSWRAEARRLEMEARDRHAAGILESGRYKYLQQKFADETTAAQRALERIRLEESDAATRLGAQLRECLGRKAAMAQQVKDGTVAHGVAAAEIGRLDEEIAALRDALAEFNRVLTVEDVAALGGALHMELAEYPLRLSALPPTSAHVPRRSFQRLKLSPRQLRFALLCGTIIALGMGAIWFMLSNNRALDMRATWSTDAPENVVLLCANRGSREFVLYVPAPEAGATPQADTFQIQVDDTGPQGTTTSLRTWTAWTVDTRATQYSNPQRISPGKHATYILHLDRVPPLAPGPHRLTIRCINPSGWVVNTATVDLQR